MCASGAGGREAERGQVVAKERAGVANGDDSDDVGGDDGTPFWRSASRTCSTTRRCVGRRRNLQTPPCQVGTEHVHRTCVFGGRGGCRIRASARGSRRGVLTGLW